jgi:hypothetical protein
MSKLVDEVLGWINVLSLPKPVLEHQFAAPVRRWQFDMCWPDRKLAVEIEGGLFIRGRHSRGATYEKDAEKYNTAALMGWTVLRFGPKGIKSGYAIETIRKALLGNTDFAGNELPPPRSAEKERVLIRDIPA